MNLIKMIIKHSAVSSVAVLIFVFINNRLAEMSLNAYLLWLATENVHLISHFVNGLKALIRDLFRTLTITVPGWTTASGDATIASSSSSCCLWLFTWRACFPEVLLFVLDHLENLWELHAAVTYPSARCCPKYWIWVTRIIRFNVWWKVASFSWGSVLSVSDLEMHFLLPFGLL